MLRFVSFGMLGIYWITIFVGTHIPHGLRNAGRVDDKLLHFVAYAGLAFLLAAALRAMRVRFGGLLLPMLIAAIYGCLDEISQMTVPGRQADIADWVADLIGAGVGICAFYIFSSVTSRLFVRQGVPESDTISKSAA